MTHLLTSESVTAGHPDKICDQVSDAIVNAILTQDPTARVACECMATNETFIIAGEVKTTANVDYAAIAQETIAKIGYDSDESFYNAHTLQIQNFVHTQSPDIAQGVDTGGAGDQGLMFGYACDETPEYMPLPIMLAHRLATQLHHVRTAGILQGLLPDGKTQVTVNYEDDQPKEITTILVSTQHKKGYAQSQLRADVIREVMTPIVEEYGYALPDTIFVNPTGIFEIGGPVGDCGLTGRKIIVDTYGGIGRHGGGAFSGKDPSKVDRSGAYMARYIAKNIIASGICRRCEIQLTYGIGLKDPLSVYVDCFGTEKVEIDTIITAIKNHFDLSVGGIVTHLGLHAPIYEQTATYGHFGRDIFPREKLDAVQIFQQL